MANKDGSMSAEEYLRHAADMPAAQSFRRTAPAAGDMSKTHTLLKLFQHAVANEPEEGAEADLVLSDVHILPTRAVCRTLTASPPMIAQQASGKYPTIEDHVAKRSTAFLSEVDDLGRTTFRELTPEDEHAIRHRTSGD